MTSAPTPEGRRFIHLFGGSRENSDLVSIARGACREGFAVIPIEPGGKKAICTLTDRQRRAADTMAANAAREAGRRHWEHARHDCGLSHAVTDPKDADRIFRRLVELTGHVPVLRTDRANLGDRWTTPDD